ncbi:MAG: glycosyltransferase family 4 protein [Planctomycetota bacterium]|jgi:glycosyltransferase involved in cell wall biosynthesis
MRIAHYCPGSVRDRHGDRGPVVLRLDEHADLDVGIVPGNLGATASAGEAHEAGTRLGRDLVTRFVTAPSDERPEIWVTEGLSVASPDWIGPFVAAMLDIPYILVDPVIDRDALFAADPLVADVVRDALLQAASTVVLSSFDARTVRPLLSDPERMILLLPWIDASPYVTAGRIRGSHKAALRSRLNIHDQGLWLLTEGDMGPTAIDDFRLLARGLSRCANLDWHLIVLGDGPAREEIRAELRGLPAPRVHFRPPVTERDRVNLYVSSDIFLWPGTGGGRLTAVLQAQASGMPVIAGDHAGVRDRVLDGATGRVVEAGNAEAFAQAVGFIVEHPAFLKSMSEQAFDSATSEHDIRAAAALLAVALRDVLETRRQAG